MNNNVSFDSMIQMAAKESVYRQMDSFPSKKELENMFSPSQTHENKMNKLIKKENRFDKLVEFNRHFSKVASVMFIIFTVTLTPLISAKAVRESIVETVIEWKEDFASIFFKSENTPAVINEAKINYMVDGFVSDGPDYQDDITYRDTFINGAKFINININSEPATTIAHIDNEFSDYYIITIDDIEGIWIYRNNVSTLIVPKDKYLYDIEGDIDISELINIYKNIEIF